MSVNKKHKDILIQNKNMDKLSLIQNSDFKTFNISLVNKQIFDSYKFRNENSKDINIKLIKIAESTIKRYETLEKLLNIILDVEKVEEIEKGIFEFSLLHVTTHGLEYKTVSAVYNDKVYDIIYNMTDPENKSLLNSILNNDVKAYAIAFLSPQQLNPERWIDLLEKKKFREDKENNMATTDRYTCRKCGERKAKVTELQIRGADEPTSLFVTCLVCYNTFIK
ncbi:transcription elongation factor TFIIS [Catovirus CTV1]|uniref:Transcription elongation factor TFIIS n=1 Tax=Catovirus CTV1 TaxID=1977631 RepID=A0A1V0SC19_9VIRU|nr:transcription elongation factor TFIIS [Catovirus CTV1]